ncbi:MAG TPA: diguanylate cyclase [Bryobacteraceae bacterium]|nr:diguanylate cyclase [Bryobacteraceae bacterium]
MTAAARLNAGFGAGFALLLGIGIPAAIQTFHWEESAQSIARINRAIERLGDLSLESKDAEDAARRYLVTGDPRSLAESRKQLLQAESTSGNLITLIEPDSRQRQSLATVDRLVDRQATTLLTAIGSARTRSGNPADVREAVEALDKAGLSSGIQVAIADLKSRESGFAIMRGLWQQRITVVSRLLFGLAAIFSFAMVVAAGWRVAAAQKSNGRPEGALASKSQQYRQVVELAGDLIYRTDAEGRFVFCNPAALMLLHLTKAEVIGRSWVKLVRQDQRRAAERFYMRQFVRRQKNTYHEFPLIDGRGHTRWIGQNVQLILESENGSVAGFQAIAREITDRKQAEQELKRSRRFVERIAATTPGILYIYDLIELRTVYSNREIISVLGHKPEEVQETESLVQKVIHPDDQAMVAAHHEAMRYAGDGEIRKLEFRARHVDGHWVWLSTRDTSFERGSDGLVKQIVGIAQDVTAHKGAQGKLARANYDALTGLPNRRHFWTGMQSALRQASLMRTGTAVCLFDIDLFGEINDRYGQAAGDEVLEVIGNIVRAELRATDVAGRLGGDEFCVALPGVDRDECVRVAERIRDRICSVSFGFAPGSPFCVSATFGVAVSEPDGHVKDLMEAAGQALFRAKSEGRNRVLV